MNLTLFLGFLPDALFQKELSKSNSSLVSLFVGKVDYLQEVTVQGKQYLGKYLTTFPTLEQIEIVEKHLLSLLNKLTPSYPFLQNPPVLVTINE